MWERVKTCNKGDLKIVEPHVHHNLFKTIMIISCRTDIELIGTEIKDSVELLISYVSNVILKSPFTGRRCVGNVSINLLNVVISTLFTHQILQNLLKLT